MTQQPCPGEASTQHRELGWSRVMRAHKTHLWGVFHIAQPIRIGLCATVCWTQVRRQSKVPQGILTLSLPNFWLRTRTDSNLPIIHSFIPSFSKYLLSTNDMPHTDKEGLAIYKMAMSPNTSLHAPSGSLLF